MCHLTTLLVDSNQRRYLQIILIYKCDHESQAADLSDQGASPALDRLKRSGILSLENRNVAGACVGPRKNKRSSSIAGLATDGYIDELHALRESTCRLNLLYLPPEQRWIPDCSQHGTSFS